MLTYNRHQSISGFKLESVVQVPLLEMVANLRCAAKLAELEGFHGTAERLRADAVWFVKAGKGTRIELV